MRQFLLISILIAFYFAGIAQSEKTPNDSFLITAKTNKTDEEKVINAVAAANMDPYRLRSLHRNIIFENGVVVELLSALELKSMGYIINLLDYPEFLPKGYIEPIYSITTDGYLIQNHKVAQTK